VDPISMALGTAFISSGTFDGMAGMNQVVLDAQPLEHPQQPGTADLAGEQARECRGASPPP